MSKRDFFHAHENPKTVSTVPESKVLEAFFAQDGPTEHDQHDQLNEAHAEEDLSEMVESYSGATVEDHMLTELIRSHPQRRRQELPKPLLKK
jgi:hypothetical protein